MTLQQTLEKVDLDIKNGDLGKARERLHGLLVSFPDDLSLRKRLGDIFWKLQYPAMAGRYWYLEEEKTLEMQLACAAFEEQVRADPLQILLALKFRGNVQAIENQHAGKLLLNLHQRSKEMHPEGIYFDFRNEGRKKFSSFENPKSKNNSIGCTITSILGVSLMAIGLFQIVVWVVQLVKR